MSGKTTAAVWFVMARMWRKFDHLLARYGKIGVPRNHDAKTFKPFNFSISLYAHVSRQGNDGSIWAFCILEWR